MSTLLKSRKEKTTLCMCFWSSVNFNARNKFAKIINKNGSKINISFYLLIGVWNILAINENLDKLGINLKKLWSHGNWMCDQLIVDFLFTDCCHWFLRCCCSFLKFAFRALILFNHSIYSIKNFFRPFLS